jgi:hypothetical protein
VCVCVCVCVCVASISVFSHEPAKLFVQLLQCSVRCLSARHVQNTLDKHSAFARVHLPKPDTDPQVAWPTPRPPSPAVFSP